MLRLGEFVFAPTTEREVAYLIGAQLPGRAPQPVEDQMLELTELVETAGAEVVGSDVQHLERPNPAFCYGKGKVQELRRLRGSFGFTTLVSNEDLTPRQQRNLEDALDMKVLDRREVILDIFARHARTHEGRLQVEAAQLHHLLPRLAGGRNLSRLGGGIGTRGPGEQKLEVDRRRIRQRIRELQRDIEKVRRARRLHRAARRRSSMPVVAIVGYTNAGKSTLLNALTGADAIVADQMFATLDPTTRAARLADGRQVLLTDTVGFIQKLPTELIAAFRATLEELTEADIVMHVLDISRPGMHERFTATNVVLDELQTLDKPLVLALNKRDLLPSSTVERLVRRGDWSPYEEAVAVSARTAQGLDSLRGALQRLTESGLVRLQLLLPYDRAGLESELRQRGRVLAREYVAEGIRLAVDVPEEESHRFQEFALPTPTPRRRPTAQRSA